MGKKLCFMLFLISCSFCLCYMSNTYSRYVTGTTSNIDMSFAKWQILVNNQDITNQNNSSISFVPTIEANQNTRTNTIAPTSKGYFDININPENVDVSFRYQIGLSIDNEDIPDLIVTKYAILDEDYQEGDDITYTTLVNNTITNEMLFNNNTANFAFEPFTVRIYFEWLESEDELMDNEDDTEIGVSASEDDLTFTITANTVFEQIVTPVVNEVEENNNIENNSNNI